MATYRSGYSDIFEPANLHLAGGKVETLDIEEHRKTVKYPQYLVPTPKDEAGKFPRIENPGWQNKDRGHFGDSSFKHLFPKGQDAYAKFDLSPDLGTEITDPSVQLSQLDSAGKDDLALYLETRGLAVFRNQDFRDKGPKFAKDFGEYFGPLHVHPVGISAKNQPELLTTFRPAGDSERYDEVFKDRTKGFAWHSDISFEPYPASFSFFVALEAPPAGGDTVFIDLREAYRRLSPKLQEFLETLTVIHSNVYQNKFAELQNQTARVQGDLFTRHPLVRVHPVTGEKSLFFSHNFIQRIEGVKRQESDFILNFLLDHVQSNPEFQVRAQHRGTESGSVIAWDNRIVLHSATLDYLRHRTVPRHHFRITVVGERPYNEVIGDGEGNKVKVEVEKPEPSSELSVEKDGATKSGEIV
ncbi:alpha-ketoglutarate-dependent sulfonate dioxygenase [Diutina catenulata]